MTRKEITGHRDLFFSQWIRKKLPDSSTGYCVSDLDFIVWNWKTKEVMMLEIKTRNSYPRPFQKIMWLNIHNWVLNGITKEWNYYGFHLIQFQNNSFTDGKCFFDGTEITENDLIEILSFKYHKLKKIA